MDFNSLDTRTAAENARPYHLRHQTTGAPIMDGDKPCLVLVRGAASRTVQAAIKAQNRADMTKAKDDDRGMEDIHRGLIKAAARLIVGFENVNRGDKPATVDDVDWFLDLNFMSIPHQIRKDDAEWLKPSFAQQIVDFATDDASFLGQTLPS